VQLRKSPLEKARFKTTKMRKGRRADRSDRRNCVLFRNIFDKIRSVLIKWRKEMRNEEKKTEGMTTTERGMTTNEAIAEMKEDGKRKTIITSQENDPKSHSLP
jgi:hypothetical protein